MHWVINLDCLEYVPWVSENPGSASAVCTHLLKEHYSFPCSHGQCCNYFMAPLSNEENRPIRFNTKALAEITTRTTKRPAMTCKIHEVETGLFSSLNISLLGSPAKTEYRR